MERKNLLFQFSTCIAVTAVVCAGAAVAQIQPYARNPNYWQYAGRPVLLVGASDRDNLFQWAGHGSRLADHLDLLKSCSGNYVRCTMSSREYIAGAMRWDMLPYPFAKAGGKYDLAQWNEIYWSKLRAFLAETSKRGIIVQLEIWDRWNESGDSTRPGNGWYDSPWNPNNNVTYTWSDSALLKESRTAFYNAFHLAAVREDPVLLPLQQRFVRKILDEVIDGRFDHVLFQIDNESGIGDQTLEPDPYWAKFIRDYGKSKRSLAGARDACARRPAGADRVLGGYELYVCTSRRFHVPTPYHTRTFQDSSNPEIREPILNPAFNFCDISQNNGSVGQTHYDNLVWFRQKVIEHGARPINHVKAYHFNWPIGGDFHQRTAGSDDEAAARLWRAVFGGAASFRFHRRTSFGSSGILDGFGLSPPAQQHLRSMRLFLEAVDLFSMEPHNDLLSARSDNEAYCLAEPGRQYAVFFSGEADQSVVLNLASAGADLRWRWLDVAHSRWVDEGKIVRADTRTLRSPGPGHWVAVLKKGSER